MLIVMKTKVQVNCFLVKRVGCKDNLQRISTEVMVSKLY